MNCKEVSEKIPAFLEDRLKTRESREFIEHLKGCSDCYEEVDVRFMLDRAEKIEKDDRHADYELGGLLEKKLRRMEKENRRKSIYWFGVILLAVLNFGLFVALAFLGA